MKISELNSIIGKDDTLLGFNGEEIFSFLRSHTAFFNCWGVDRVHFLEKALCFRVAGFQFEGWVVVALHSSDTFQIRFSSDGIREVKDRVEDVYIDQLVEVIDEHVETGNMDEEEYKNAFRRSLLGLGWVNGN